MKRIVYGIMRRTGITFIVNYIYDALRFARSKNSNALVLHMDSEQAKMHLLRLMHSLEKGLALPAPSPGFGKEKALHLMKEADAYLKRFGNDDIYKLTLATLAAHQNWQSSVNNEGPGFSVDDLLQQAQNMSAGAHEVTREQIWAHARIDFDAFTRCRHSVRNFTGEVVPEDDILDAIRIATKSPSVCNRACARAYYSTDRTVMNRLLTVQNGNRGFGDKAGAVIVVAADMRAFYKNGERNQGWIDGGLFAMSLHYAFHAKGYGACMLNWSMDALKDSNFRKQFGIPTEHLVVMLMAVGHLPTTFKVAESPRRKVTDFAFKLD